MEKYRQELSRALIMIGDGYNYHDGRWYFAHDDRASISIDKVAKNAAGKYDCPIWEAYMVAYAIKDWCLCAKWLAKDPMITLFAGKHTFVSFDRIRRQWYNHGKPINYAEANKIHSAAELAAIRYSEYIIKGE